MKNTNRKTENYADALLNIIKTCRNEKLFRNDLKTFCNLVQTNSNLKSFLSSNKIYNAGKVNALQDLIGGSITESLVHFILIMASQGDIMLLPDVQQIFLRKLSISENIRFGEIHTPYPISNSKISKLEELMSDYIGMEVSLELTIDKSISGGLKIIIDDMVFDDTIEKRLSQMRKQIAL